MTVSRPTRRGPHALVLAGALLLAGCAAPPRATDDAAPARTGRLALSVQDDPSGSFSAGFALRGQPERGELTLTNPLGGTVAVLRWEPGRALLQVPGREPQAYDSLEAMVAQATGAPLPVAALFDWLDGVATPVPGWEPDLSSVSEGRLRARRVAPPPAADLRLVLDR